MLQEQLYRASLKWIKGHTAIESRKKEDEKSDGADGDGKDPEKEPAKTATNMERVQL